VATKPRGWKVRSVAQGEHVVRIAFPPGRRETGSGHVVEILHPRHENPGYCPSKTRMTNPAELVLMTANPMNPRVSGSRFTDAEKKELRRIGLKPSHYTTPEDVASAKDMLRRTEEIRQRERSGFYSRRNPRSGGEHYAIRWHTGNISQAFHSEDEAQRILDRFHGAGTIIRVNPMPAHRERYRNPIATSEAGTAREIREGFTHAESRGYRVADEPHIPAGDYAELGTSGYVTDGAERAEAYLAVKPAKGGYRLQLTLEQRGITFVSDTSRRQIWIAGRYEMSEREVAQFTDDRRPSVNLGECVGIGYIAVKYHPEIENHAAGKRILWEHQFGEETGVCPYLIYDRTHARLLLEGGAYRVEDAGIVN